MALDKRERFLSDLGCLGRGAGEKTAICKSIGIILLVYTEHGISLGARLIFGARKVTNAKNSYQE